eukprot:5999596-Amphidinium_carterae.1
MVGYTWQQCECRVDAMEFAMACSSYPKGGSHQMFVAFRDVGMNMSMICWTCCGTFDRDGQAQVGIIDIGPCKFVDVLQIGAQMESSPH